MKYLIALLLFVIIFACGNDSGLNNDNEDLAVSFVDPNLEEVVRETLGMDTATIYLSDLQGITTLDAGDLDIANISGIGNIENLISLNLERNSITNVGPLRGLSDLEVLNLGNNQVEIIDAVSSLISLQTLLLDSNQVSDLSPLAGLTGMVELNLSANQIININALAPLFDLEYLYLDKNQVQDITALASLVNARLLSLNANQIEDISPLLNNTGLGSGDEVRLTGNPLSTESTMNHIPALQARGVKVVY
jgi:Leucine-rich repeat (LRR) protein